MICNPVIQGGSENLATVEAVLDGDGYAKIYDFEKCKAIELSAVPTLVKTDNHIVIIQGGPMYNVVSLYGDDKPITTSYPFSWSGNVEVRVLSPDEYPNGFSVFKKVRVVASFMQP